jgi:hypothetical protein
VIPLETVISEQRENPVASVFDALVSEISTVTQSTRLGRVVEVARGTVIVRGLEGVATLGDRVQIGQHLGGEVVALRPDSITILTDSLAEGLAIGEVVRLRGQSGLAPDNSWIGRVIDPFGTPLDGRPLYRGPTPRPLLAPAPPPPRPPPNAAALANALKPASPSLTPSSPSSVASASASSQVPASANPPSWAISRAVSPPMSSSSR